jgi:hypothetical protein
MQLDVLEQFLPEIRDRGEDPARDEVPLDLREPEFHLVQPRAVGRREVEVDPGMVGQPLPNVLRPVRGKVVEDDMQLAAPAGIEPANNGFAVLGTRLRAFALVAFSVCSERLTSGSHLRC